MATHELAERDADLARIARALDAGSEGRGAVALVEGPAGIGKTALLTAATAAARVPPLRATGAPLEVEYPWGIVRQLFEPWLLGLSPSLRDQVFREAAAPARVVVGGAHPVRDEAPFAAVRGLYWMVVNAAELAGPLTIVVDDAHLCDDASLRWLAYLAPRLEDLAITLALGVRRPHERADHPALLHIADLPLTRHVRPRALSEDAVAAVLAERLGPLGAGLAAACLEATGGNPFMLGALIDDLVQLPPGRTPDPETVRSLRPAAISRAVLLRLGTLPGEARAVARAAALLAGSATTARLAEVAALSGPATLEGLAALTTAGILVDGLPPAFVHPLVHAVVLDDLTAAQRAAGHARAAAVLREQGARVDEIAAQLLQAEPAADEDTCVTLEAAADAALAAGAPEAATALLRRALREPPAPERAPAIHRRLGRALLRANGAEGVEQLRLALTTADRDASAEVALELARALEGLSRNTEAVEVYESALSAFAAGDDSALCWTLKAGLATAAMQHLSTVPRALGVLGEVAQSPPRTDGADAIIRAALALAATAGGAHEGVALAAATLEGDGLFDAEPSIAIGLAVAPLVWGDRLDEALAAWDEVVRRAGVDSAPLRLAFGLTFRGEVHLRAGRLADAEADLRAALAVPQELWTQARIPVDTRALLAQTLVARGRAGEASAELEGLGPATELSDYQGNNQALLARGQIALALGDTEAAAVDLLELGARAEAWMLRNPAALPWRSNAAIALRAKDGPRALALAEEELALARGFGVARAIGVALRACGLLRPGPEGLAQLEAAEAVLRDSPAVLEHAATLVDLGAAQRRAGRRDDARALLSRGLDRATEHGAPAVAERARGELALLGARPRRDRITGRDALTTSEVRVARLAGGGMTNREVAEALWVTTKTVETHLGRVYRKLDIASRGDLQQALEREISGS